ncbi:MAG: hypothetical protein R2822_14965 [Spirosomataceae bacterium]
MRKEYRCILIGGTVIAEERGFIKFENAIFSILVTAEKSSLTKNNIVVMTGYGGSNKARVNQIKSQIENTTSDYDREKLQERLAKLSGVAILDIEKATEVEMKAKRSRGRCPQGGLRAAIRRGYRSRRWRYRSQLSKH